MAKTSSCSSTHSQCQIHSDRNSELKGGESATKNKKNDVHRKRRWFILTTSSKLNILKEVGTCSITNLLQTKRLQNTSPTKSKCYQFLWLRLSPKKSPQQQSPMTKLKTVKGSYSNTSSDLLTNVFRLGSRNLRERSWNGEIRRIHAARSDVDKDFARRRKFHKSLSKILALQTEDVSKPRDYNCEGPDPQNK
eukprot:5487997-Amphidinium_carterae.1